MIKKHLKKILPLSVITAAIFIACAHKKKTSITLFTWTPADEYTVNQRIIQKFQHANPQIKINHINDASGRAMDKLQTMLAGSSPPDVMSIHGAYFIPLASKNTLLDLEPMTADADFNLQDFYPELIDGCRYQGKLYSLPRYTSVYVLFYNRGLFQEENLSYPGSNWTWSDYLLAAKKLTRDHDGDGVTDQYGCIIDFWGARIYPWIWQNNGQIFSADGLNCLLDQKEAVEAVQFLYDLQFRHRVTPKSLTHEFKNNVEFFHSGKAAMFISGAWDIQNLRKNKNIDWDIAHLPRRKKSATILGMENYAISKNSRYPYESWKLLRFLLSAETQKPMGRELEKQPSRRSAADDYIRHGSYNRRIMIEAMAYAVKPPNIAKWGEISHYLQDELDLIWVKGKDPAFALRTAVSEINKNLQP